MSKFFKKMLAAFLALLLFVAGIVPSYAAVDSTDANLAFFDMTYSIPADQRDYTIENPYKDIDWEAWGQYKTQLHCHTTASDGFLTIKEAVQEHYDLNYDIVAITDHGTNNLGWNVAPQVVPLMRFIKKERTKMADIIPLTDEEYQGYLTGTAASDRRTHTNGMLDVPLGNELNMATPVSDCHLTGYFSTYGQGLAGVYGDYETPAEEVKKDGGITFLSHIGEFVYPDKDTVNHTGKVMDAYYPDKFARLFIDNAGSALGMGINSATDAHTRCDRILYDQILQRTIPNGVVPWCNTFADSHNWDAVNDAYTMTWMENFTMDDFRESLEKGQFFSVSHYSNGYELNGMAEIPGFVEQKVYDEKLFLLDNTPNVTKVTVDNENDSIFVEGENFNQITWVSNGNVILREDITNGKATLDLHRDDLLDDPYLFVRFYITGENGICYSQPFVINVEGNEYEEVDVPETHDLPAFLRGFVSVVDVLLFRFNPIIWIFKYFGLGYNPLGRLFS